MGGGIYKYEFSEDLWCPPLLHVKLNINKMRKEFTKTDTPSSQSILTLPSLNTQMEQTTE